MRSMTTSLISFCLLAVATVLANSEEGKPNILFIVADDLGYEKLGCYGGLEADTPNLNRLAEEGMRFSRAYGSPVCTPTRMSIYTGLYPTRHGFTSVLPVHNGTKQAVDFKNGFATYATQLREQGYLTSVTGKWQLATLELHPNHIRDAGFDSWCVWQIWREGAKTIRYWDPTLNEEGQILEGLINDFGPDVLVRYVVEQMEEAKAAGRPFMIHHNMLLPHEPIIETPDDRILGNRASLDSMINYMDRLIGQLVRAVDELGLAENTCIFFLGDNGTDTIDQKRKTRFGTVHGGKRTLDDGGTHLPLIVRWKGRIEGGGVAEDLVDVVDLFPTFCEMSGAPLPKSAPLDGVSMAGRIFRGEPVGREVTVAGFRNEFSVFDGRWRLNSNGALLDAVALPDETKVEETELPPEAETAMATLRPYLKAAD
ncbi:MAG: sulfatase-like hydrolase/transferase [Verrucomicrobiota bacterium]